MKTSLTTALAAGLLVPTLMTRSASATSVSLDTSLGEVVIDLLEDAAPLTVENFLGYVERGDYDGTIFHRSISDFIVQGGGFVASDGDASPAGIDTVDPVVNEPGVSNLRGTVALAKLGDDPDSGTSQFFFNLTDNSENLDNQNGGFTVFGNITDGLDVVDAIAALPTVDGSGAFTDLPVLNDTTPTSFGEVDFVLVNSATVIEDVVAVDPVDPVDPVEPIDPVDPVEPLEPVDPVVPTNPAAVPSPSALAAGLLGLGAMVARRRRRA